MTWPILTSGAVLSLALLFAAVKLWAPWCARLKIESSALGHRRRSAPLGLAVLLAFLIPLAVVVLPGQWTQPDRLYPQEIQETLVIVLMASGLVLFLWGCRSDRGQTGLETIFILWTVQAVLWGVGLRIERVMFGIPGVWQIGVVEFPLWMSLVVTLFWLSIVSSVVELLDSIDGAAGLVSGLAALAVFIQARLFSPDDLFVQAFAWLLSITCFGAAFLGRPGGRWHLGKNGSYLLGLWLASLTVLARQKGAAASVITPFLVLAVILVIVLFGFVERSLGFGHHVRRERNAKRHAGGEE
jgi:UDP-GlcNAc:undecaprenyl-phosphate GlcNAc-1-phosphate transferase